MSPLALFRIEPPCRCLDLSVSYSFASSLSKIFVCIHGHGLIIWHILMVKVKGSCDVRFCALNMEEGDNLRRGCHEGSSHVYNSLSYRKSSFVHNTMRRILPGHVNKHHRGFHEVTIDAQ